MREENKDTVDKIREEVEHLVFSRISNYLSFGPGGVVLKAAEDMTPEQLAAVAEVSETPAAGGGRNIKFKLYSKEKNLELLMKYYGLIVNRKEISSPDGVPPGYVNMKQIIKDIRKAQRPGTLWNEGPMLETGDLD